MDEERKTKNQRLTRACSRVAYLSDSQGGRSWLKADHPSAICFLHFVYMQKVVLVPNARIFLVLGSS